MHRSTHRRAERRQPWPPWERESGGREGHMPGTELEEKGLTAQGQHCSPSCRDTGREPAVDMNFTVARPSTNSK